MNGELSAALAYRAQSHGELEKLTDDLPATTGPATRRRKPVRWEGVLIGDVKHTGRWRIRDRTHMLMVIGPGFTYAPSA